MSIPTVTGQHWPPLSVQAITAFGAMMPTYIAPTETFVVPEHRQALFAQMIDNEGTMIIDGALIGVD